MSISKPSTTTFRPSYILEFPWVKEDPRSNTSAMCTWCKTTVNIASMGKTALKSHSKSAKHRLNEANRDKCLNIGMFFKIPVVHEASRPTSSSVQTSASSNQFADMPGPSTQPSAVPLSLSPAEDQRALTKTHILKKFLFSESVTKSEIFWCLQIVINHLPFRTAAKLAAGFHKQFPDSEIAGKIKLQRTKIAYTIVFGLAPYFRRQLESLIKDASHIVVCFDEALNKISQKQQMDIHIRFCNNSKVETRYFSSVFLGRSKATDLFDALTEILPKPYMQKVIQISMDGPNVNLKLLSELETHLKEIPDSHVLLNIGTCGLHTLHNAFKVGINSTGWEIITFLRALYNLFKNSPARRSEYILLSGSKVFPLQFCAVRWVESGNAAERALQILPNVTKYLAAVAKQPDSHSFKVVKEKMKDKMLAPKLAFFGSIASMVEPFLREFQGDQPMAPFLYQELNSLVLSLMERIVKEDVLKSANNRVDKIQLTAENLKPAKTIHIGFATRDALRNSSTTDRSQLDVLTFRHECRTALVAMVKKLMEKSPLHYNLTKQISCLDPNVIRFDSKVAETRLTHCLDSFVTKNIISGTKADSIKKQYKEVFTSQETVGFCKTFKRNEGRLDTFLFDIIHNRSGGTDRYKHLKDFCTVIMTLSHGNSTVERGFSINSECIIENIKEESLVALRQVYDGIHSAGCSIDELEISKDLVHSARNAHSLYTEYLRKKEKEISEEEKDQKLKRKTDLEKKELEEKKAKIIEEARKQAALIDDRIANLKPF